MVVVLRLEEAPKTETLEERRERRAKLQSADAEARATLRELYLQGWVMADSGRTMDTRLTLAEVMIRRPG